jgi:hypothetical protein
MRSGARSWLRTCDEGRYCRSRNSLRRPSAYLVGHTFRSSSHLLHYWGVFSKEHEARARRCILSEVFLCEPTLADGAGLSLGRSDAARPGRSSVTQRSPLTRFLPLAAGVVAARGQNAPVDSVESLRAYRRFGPERAPRPSW